MYQHFFQRMMTVLIFVAAAASCATAWARKVKDWPYARLFEEADLVVLASAVSSVNCDDATDENPWRVRFMGVNTTFRIRHEIKGESAANTITVLHYRLEDGVQLENGPLLVSFHTKRVPLDINAPKVVLPPSDFLLFLSMRKDGRFELVSGQLDPRLSVRVVREPLPTEFSVRQNVRRATAVPGPRHRQVESRSP